MKHISGNNNNQAGRDLTILSSLVHNVKVPPRDIKLKAIINHDWLMLFIYILCMGIMLSFLYTTIVSTTFLILSSTVTGLVIIYLIDGVQKFMMKYSPWHITYVDGVMVLNGRERKFYDEIWSLSYKKTWIGNGIISFYGVNPNNHKPYHRKIKFMHDAEARYVYDCFMDEERINKYKDSLKYENRR